MARTRVRVFDGDALDTICYLHYGHLNGTVEFIYDVNPGLADVPQPYTSDTVIWLPDLPARITEERSMSLWD